MKIAQIAPTWYRLPPTKYGGIEIVAYNITEELVKRGHDVSLFASKDSKTSATLIPSMFDSPKDVWKKQRNDYLYIVAKAVEMQDEFDILHFHAGIDILPQILTRYCKKPYLLTYHNHNVSLLPYYEGYKNVPVISISDNFRNMFPKGTNFVKTVYNGIAINDYQFTKGGKKFAFLGTISHDKGTYEAIKIAKSGDWELEIAAKLPPTNQDYYDQKIEPQLNEKIKYIGQVDIYGKNTLLGSSRALLFPINWEEPFGLVLVEAMATGTPVIAFKRGSVPEIIEDGVNGFIIEAGDIEGAISAAKKIQEMPEDEYQKMRQRCRKSVENRFTVEKMVDGYEAVYKKMTDKKDSRKNSWFNFRWQ